MLKKTTYTFLVNSTDDIDYVRICREAPEGIDAIMVERIKRHEDSRLLARGQLRCEITKAGWEHYVTGPEANLPGGWRSHPISRSSIRDVVSKARAAIEAKKNLKQVKVEYL